MAENTPGYAESANQLIREAERLTPLLRSHAHAIEDGRRLTRAVHHALLDAGFYRMTMPPESGAPRPTLPAAMRVLETLAQGDGSSAWSVWAALGMPAMAAFMSEEGAAELFTRPDACVVGSVVPAGRAIAVDGGYRVSGRWPFVSGIYQATHAGAVCFVFDGSEQRMTSNRPARVVPVWPVADCTIIDTWDTTGLRGTGSNDIAVDDLFVPSERVVDFSQPPRPKLAPIHYVHVENAGNITIAAMAVGIADASLSAFRELGPGKTLANGELLAESALGKTVLADASSKLAQARGYLYETAELMAEEIAAGTYQDQTWFPRTSLASVSVVDVAIDVATRVYREAGSSAIYRSQIFDRCLRDLLTLGAHKTVQHFNLQVHGGATFASTA